MPPAPPYWGSATGRAVDRGRRARRGRLPTTTADGWQVQLAGPVVTLAGPAGESAEVSEPEEIRAFGFSPDGDVFIIASSPSVVIFRRPQVRPPKRSRPICGRSGRSPRLDAVHSYAELAEAAGPWVYSSESTCKLNAHT